MTAQTSMQSHATCNKSTSPCPTFQVPTECLRMPSRLGALAPIMSPFSVFLDTSHIKRWHTKGFSVTTEARAELIEPFPTPLVHVAHAKKGERTNCRLVMEALGYTPLSPPYCLSLLEDARPTEILPDILGKIPEVIHKQNGWSESLGAGTQPHMSLQCLPEARAAVFQKGIAA